MLKRELNIGHGALSLETAVRRLTFDPAGLWGIPERGLVRPGWYADLNVVDLDRLDVELADRRLALRQGGREGDARAEIPGGVSRQVP